MYSPSPHITRLPPYTPIEPFEVLSARLGFAPEQIVKLDANENPYGPSPRARQALAELQWPHIYPDPESRQLRAALAEFSGLPAEYLMAGAGADELIDLLMRVLLQPGQAVLNCPPTFGMYSFDADLNAGVVVSVPRRPDFRLDLPAIEAAVAQHRPRLLFLATPNNPDGSLPAPDEIERLLALPTIVVLDEAYVEFSGEGFLGSGLTRLPQVPERDNLVVLRTFSKWAGLAGLRVGYGAFPGWLMPALWKAKQPYNINVAASAAALASLDDLPYLANQVERLLEERQRLFAALQDIPYLRPYPTRANFILCRVTGADAGALKSWLAQQHGILVRYFNKPGLSDHIRISVGRPQDTERVVRALEAYER